MSCYIFCGGFSAFLEIFSRKQYPSFYSDKLLERDTQHHIITFPQFGVAGYFYELLLPVHWQFELVPCSHTGKPRFIEVFFDVGLATKWTTNCSSPTGAVLVTFRSNLKYIRIKMLAGYL
jgi:hypothetical protein